jgi:hypothetical protein
MIVVSRNFTVGLSSFLLQASLSLDRVSAQDLSPLIEFYSKTSRHTLRDVLARLKCINHGRCPENRFQGETRQTIVDVMITLVAVCSFKQVIVRFPRLSLVEIALQHYEILLADKSKWNQTQVMDVRLEIAYTGALLEELIHPKSVLEATYKVYHLNHAENVKLKTVEEIAGVNWLISG